MTEATLYTAETAPEASKPLLENSVKTFGMIPNLHAVMAESPALLEGYQKLHTLAGETKFTPAERTVIWMAVNVANKCHYCVPAHTMIAHGEKVDTAIIDALRDETPLPDDRLEALRSFTLVLRATHGRPGETAIARFKKAGFDNRSIQDLLVIYAQKVLSNFTNALFETPVDAPFQTFAWAAKED